MLKNICAIGAILLLSTTSTMAAVPKECAADVKAHCGGVQPGAGRIRACINSHLKDLTPMCQTILVRAAAIGKACRGDVRKICAGVKPGLGVRVGARLLGRAFALTIRDCLKRRVRGYAALSQQLPPLGSGV